MPTVGEHSAHYDPHTAHGIRVAALYSSSTETCRVRSSVVTDVTAARGTAAIVGK